MAWDDTKQTADDPNNPSGIEQLTAAEWNAMVSDQKGRIEGVDVSEDGTVEVTTDGVNFTTNLDVTVVNGEAVVSLDDAIDLTQVVSDTITANNSLTASTSFTDPAGVQHTGELADIDDASAEKTIAPPGVEIENGNAVAMGVPVPNGEELSVSEWGIRTSEDTTPVGLSVQLVDSADTVIAEESTSYNGNVSASVSNSSGSVTWYYFRFENTTGADIIVGNTPDTVYGNISYEVQ